MTAFLSLLAYGGLSLLLALATARTIRGRERQVPSEARADDVERIAS